VALPVAKLEMLTFVFLKNKLGMIVFLSLGWYVLRLVFSQKFVLVVTEAD
jgi:hypothetical protein